MSHTHIAGKFMIHLCPIIHMPGSNGSLLIAMILRANNSCYPAAILLSLRRKQSYLCSTAHSNSQKNFLLTH